jgi:hypothetical protein
MSCAVLFCAAQAPHAPEPSLAAMFSFVLLDAETRKPVPVPPLVPQTEQVSIKGNVCML